MPARVDGRNPDADILVLTRNAAGILDGQVAFPDKGQADAQGQVCQAIC